MAPYHRELRVVDTDDFISLFKGDFVLEPIYPLPRLKVFRCVPPYDLKMLYTVVLKQILLPFVGEVKVERIWETGDLVFPDVADTEVVENFPDLYLPFRGTA